LSSTYLGSGPTWGDEVTRGDSYAMDSRNGATTPGVRIDVASEFS
jgi:hypothetical protein